MRNLVRTGIAAALALGLVAVFLRNANLADVWTAMKAARLGLVAASVALTLLTYLVRTERWQYLLGPLGSVPFSTVFRATVIGFAASSVLPARAGEVLRPYLLARRAGLSVTATLATIILERVLDLVSVLLLLLAYLLWFDPGMEARDSSVFRAIRIGGLVMTPVAIGALALMFVMAGDPERLHAWLLQAERLLPARVAQAIARVAQTFAEGFAVVRRPQRLLAALAWSLVLWLVIAFGVWTVAAAFRIDMPITGGWLMLAPLVVGVAVPTPGSVGGFHEAFRLGATAFFGADNDTAIAAAIVLHASSFLPVVVVGLVYIVQDGLRLGGLQQMAARGDMG